MYAQYGWVFRWILAFIGGVFLWFTFENLWPGITQEQQLVAIAATAFAIGSLLPWPPGP